MDRSNRPFAALGAMGAMAIVAAAGITLVVSQKRRRPAFSRPEWDKALQEDGTISGFREIAEDIMQRGLDPAIRADVWPFLLEVFDHASTYAQRQHQHYLMTSQYQQLLLQCQAYEAVLKESLRSASPPQAVGVSTQPSTQRGSMREDAHSSSSTVNGRPSSNAADPQHHHHPQLQQQLPEQVRQFAEAHRVIVIDSVRTDFQKHAAALHISPEAAGSSNSTSFMSTDYASSLGAAAVSAVSQGLSSSISTLQQWQQHWLGSLLGGQAAMWGHTQAQWVSEAAQLVLDSSDHLTADSKRQASRMIAMLSAYALHDPDTGYCQGMSDMLLPLLLLMDDDALVFWCFVSLMQRLEIRRNFSVDERGIFHQLQLLGQVLESFDGPLMYQLKHLGAAECHFAYRMVVVMMRRDMPMPKLLQLWEILWAYSWQRRHCSSLTAPQLNRNPPETVEHSSSYVSGSVTTATVPSGDPEADVAEVEQPPARQDRSTLPDGKATNADVKTQPVDSGPSTNVSTTQPHVELFICFVAAVIHSQRRTVLDHCFNADDVLRVFHSSRRLDIWQCLDRAQELLHATIGS